MQKISPFTNNKSVICLMKYIGKKYIVKHKKCLIAFRGMDNVRVTILYYEFNFTHCKYSCKFENKVNC